VVTHPLGPAGENATRTLLNILTELGGVSLITADLPANSTIRDSRDVVELMSVDVGDNVFMTAVQFLLNQLRMCAAICKRSEEIILFFGATAYLLPILFARIAGKTVIIEPRGDVPLTLRLTWETRMPNQLAWGLAGLVKIIERIGFVFAHRVVTYTSNMARQLGLDPNSSTVYPHGARYVDIDTFRPETPFDQREPVVGFIGRIDEEKGIRQLSTVAKQLPDGVTFRFVGDGPLYEWLQTELADEITAGDVELAGWIDHDAIPAELNRIKLLIMPSHPTEGLPTTILESLACGTPVYANAVAGVPDVVKEGETGFLIDCRESEIAEKVVSILKTEDLETISENGRTLIEERYCHEAAVERYRELLSELSV
jgi:glycosyltransferase involved in cell wall biosynthesis